MSKLATRGSASAKKVVLKRMPNGHFAPKGLGQVLTGQKVKVEAGDHSYDATVTHESTGSIVLSSHAKGFEVVAPDGKSKTTYSASAAKDMADANPPAKSKPAAPQSPGTNGGEPPKKLKTAWSAFDKKMAQFKEAKDDPSADKGEVGKLASQVRAAKWSIKRAGGDPNERPEWAGAGLEGDDKGVPKGEVKPGGNTHSMPAGVGNDSVKTLAANKAKKDDQIETAKANIASKADDSKADPAGALGVGSTFGSDGEGKITGITNKDQPEGKQRLSVTVDGDEYAGLTWTQLGDYLAGSKPLPDSKKVAASGDLEAQLKASLATSKPDKPKPKIESYDPKTGPSEEQKAANAKKMGKEPPAKKAPAKKAPVAAPADDVADTDAVSVIPDVDTLKNKFEALYSDEGVPDDLSQIIDDLDIVVDGDDSAAMAELTAAVERAKQGMESGFGVPDDAEAPTDAPAAPPASAPAAPAASPEAAALEAYKAAGGADPAVIAALSGKPAGAPPAASAAPPPATPASAGGLQPNSGGVSIENMLPGQSFAMNDGSKWQYHKPTSKGDFHVVKPEGGGKAKVFHGKMQPPQVSAGAGGATPAAADPASVVGDQGDDLFNKLSASVDAAKSKKAGALPAIDDPAAVSKAHEDASAHTAKAWEKFGTPDPGAGGKSVGWGDPGETPAGTKPSGGPPLAQGGGKYGEGSSFNKGPAAPDLTYSPGRGPTGKLRNFKAMNVTKLSNVILELQQHGGDPEALSAAQSALAAKGL